VTDTNFIAWTPALRKQVHPRRSAGLPPHQVDRARAHAEVKALARDQAAAWRSVCEATAAQDRPSVAAAIARLEPDVPTPCGSTAVEAALAALLAWSEQEWYRPSPFRALIDLWLADRGPDFAIEALVESLAYQTAWRGHGGEVGLRRLGGESLDLAAGFAGWSHLRRILCGLDEAGWRAARQIAGGLRSQATTGARAAIAYLFPDEPGWAEEEVRAALDRESVGTLAGALLTCLRDGGLMTALVEAGATALIGWTFPRDLDLSGIALSMLDGAGSAAVPALLALCDRHRASLKVLGELLRLVRSPEALAGLVQRFDHKEIQPAATEALLAAPEMALPLLAAEMARTRTAKVAPVLAMIVRQHPEIVSRLLPELPEDARRAVETVQAQKASFVREAEPHELPPVLAAPPWQSNGKKRRAPPELALIPLELPEELAWSSPEEEARWLGPSDLLAAASRRQWIESVPPGERTGAILERCNLQPLVGELAGDAQALRARVGELAPVLWQVEGHSWISLLPYLPDTLAQVLWELAPPRAWNLYHDDPRRFLALWGPRALSPLLALVAAQRALAFPLLLPFRSARIAPLAAEALGRTPRLRAEARRWLLRHPDHAAAGLVPPALGPAGKARAAAEAGLRWLKTNGQSEAITRSANRHGPEVSAALAERLDGDPLQAYPTRLPRLPTFFEAAALPRPILKNGAALPVPAVEALGIMIAISTPDEPYAGLAQVEAACDRASLGRFAWEAWTAWSLASTQPRHVWAETVLVLLGDDEDARLLAGRIRDWVGSGDRRRALAGLDLLALMGTDVALMHLQLLGQKVKRSWLQERAQQTLAELADRRGLSTEDLADRLVPDLGLDAEGALVLDFGPRRFRVGFDDALRPCVFDGTGKRLADLPKPGHSDDAVSARAAADRWKALKRDARTLIGQQIGRLERSMTGRRRLAQEPFRRFVVQHPLMRHLARRLVWGAFGEDHDLLGTFRIAEDGSFADVNDDPCVPDAGARIGLVHAIELAPELSARWDQVLGDYEIIQPFRQLGREAYAIRAEERTSTGLERGAGITVLTGRVLGLEARGWQRGAARDHGEISWFARPIDTGGAQLEARLPLEPGISIFQPMLHPQQKLGPVQVVPRASDDTKDALPLGDLDPVVFSELVRDLESLRG
jgi:hypothetical protein